MDAISFVLGVKSAQLRSSQLRDVIFRGRRMGGDDEVSSDDEGGRSSADATKASVTAVYEDTSGREWRFQRR
jgi:structural maintenance of chromosome 1